ncbi:hypothetical protein GCM10025866_25680 [Naasia aerilata]|uniref:Uncharacterized protein n=1 Tax=Naasia aerilata TaxID=1162966 RepID=A0ABM8GEC5_9MICO|nr:hypothetical protein GCM10025866_25680 [Naasia aerilata]
MGVQRLDERIAEDLDMAGGLPHLTGQDDARVEAHDVVPTAHDRAPPLALDVLLELHAEGAVVPGGPGPAVDLARLEDEAAPLGERDDGIET